MADSSYFRTGEIIGAPNFAFAPKFCISGKKFSHKNKILTQFSDSQKFKGQVGQLFPPATLPLVGANNSFKVLKNTANPTLVF